MIAGAEIYEFFNFTRQLGLALSGATAFWALLFLWRGKQNQGEKRKVLEWASHRLLTAFSFSFLLTASSWFILWNIWPALAHEGITLFPLDVEYRAAFFLTLPVYLVWFLFTAGMFLLRSVKAYKFDQLLPWFYGIQFGIISVLISLYAWTGDVVSSEQLFFYFHGLHSIFTLGTVLTLDFLFLSTRISITRQRHLFPFFPVISKLIFIGLGLDLLSAFLIFEQAIELSPRFFMAQTAVGILIINGTFMAGPLTRRVLNGLRRGELLQGKWRLISGIVGSISIVSWVSITFIDFFAAITLNYFQMLGIYLGAILLAFLTNIIIARSDAKKLGIASSF